MTPSSETYAFLDACRHGDVVQVKALLAADSSLINAADAKGFTPIILAVYNQSTAVTEFLLNNGADPNSQDASGNTALMGAAYKGYKDLIEKLLEKGADVNQRNYQGANALTFAATFGQMQIAELLLQKGADMFARDVRGKSPLDHAVIQENEPMVLLLERYAKERHTQNGTLE